MKPVTAAEWFVDHGVQVFPVNGKEPAVPKGTSWKDWRGTREQIARLRNYAVILGLLGVLDTDNRADELWVLQQIAHGVIPDTPLIVETARGFHRYFRLAGALPKFIYRDGHTLEFRNEGQYVGGPGSLHPSGKTYAALGWSWRWEDVPFFPADFVFDDGSCGRISPERPAAGAHGAEYQFPEAVYEKQRHHELFRLIRSCKGIGIDEEGTREIVLLANENRCHPPLDVNKTFTEWFNRAWQLRDRPFTPATTDIPDQPLEPQTPAPDYDLDAPKGSL